MRDLMINRSALNGLGEGPLWNGSAGRIWWVDVETGALCWRDDSAESLDTRPLPKRPTSLAKTSSGALLIVFRRQLALLRHPDGEIEFFDASEALRGDERLNDCAVDARGRLWVGSMDLRQKSKIGALYRLDPEAGMTRVADGFVVTNGMDWSDDGKTLFWVESLSRQVIASLLASDGSSLGPPRIVHQYPEGEMPDGMTIDEEGALWIAVVGAGRVDRMTPEGRILEIVQTPVPNPTSCTLGGQDMCTLFVTSMRIGMSDAELTAFPDSGGLFAFPVGTRGRVARPVSSATETAIGARRNRSSDSPVIARL